MKKHTNFVHYKQSIPTHQINEKKKQHTTSECCASDSNEIARSVAFSNESTHENKAQKRSGKEKNCFSSNSTTLDEEKTHSKLYKCWKYNVKFQRPKEEEGKLWAFVWNFCATNTFNGVELGHINVSTQLCQRSEKLTRIFLLFPSVGSVVSLSRSVVDRVSLLHSKAELSWLPLSLYNLDCMIRWERLANTSARNDCAWRQWERKHTKRSDTHTSVSSAQTDGSEKTENFPEPPSVIALLQTHQVETLGREEKKK